MEQSFLGHISDLRKCLLKIFLAVFLGFVLSLIPSKDLLDILTAPAGDLVFIRPAEALMAQLKVALVNGIVISFPVILWQVYLFFWPALYPREKRALLIFFPFALILFIMGVLFGYFVVARLGYTFLLSFATDRLTPMISLNTYLSFVLTSTLACALVFLLPVVVLLMTRLGLIDSSFLWRKQKIFIIGLLAFIAVLTPTADALTLLLVFIPVFLLYELTVLLVWKMERNKKNRDKRD